MQTEGRAPLNKRATLVWFGGVAGLGLALDIVTKQWAKSALADGDFVVIEDLLWFHLTSNPGAAFSTWTTLTPVLTVVAIAAAVVVAVLATRASYRPWAVALGLAQAGILGNLVNRLTEPPGPFKGHVVDFIALPNFWIFNVADICINLAAGLFLLLSWRGISLDGTRESTDE